MPQKKEDVTPSFDPGKEVFSWTAHDYHPHKRGWLWMTLFCLIFFGGAVWAVINDPVWGWLTAFTFFVAAGVYFYTHRKGDQDHEIFVLENGVLIDQKFFPREKFSGFWFVYDETVSVINLQIDNERGDDKITLQMGKHGPEFFRQNLEKIDLPELPDRKESLVDLWIRALKL